MSTPKRLFGYEPNPPAQERFAAEPDVGSVETQHQALFGAPRKNVQLWKPIFKRWPRWRRGNQGIGDCTSWATELCMTACLAMQWRSGKILLPAEAATESIYGLARVETQGGKLGGYQDGSWGAACAAAVRDFGVLLRDDYSIQTGNPDHDLRKYSAKRAKEWGNFGCGGQRDERGNGLLDQIAKQFPVKKVSQITTVEGLAAAIQNGYPVGSASMVGYGEMVRRIHKGRDGVEVGYCPDQGRWPHEMAILGVTWIDDAPWFDEFNSWGDSASGPAPTVEEAASRACSWVISPESAAKQLKAGDTWAFGWVDGMPPQELDWLDAASTY